MNIFSKWFSNTLSAITRVDKFSVLLTAGAFETCGHVASGEYSSCTINALHPLLTLGFFNGVFELRVKIYWSILKHLGVSLQKSTQVVLHHLVIRRAMMILHLVISSLCVTRLSQSLTCPQLYFSSAQIIIPKRETAMLLIVVSSLSLTRLSQSLTCSLSSVTSCISHLHQSYFQRERGHCCWLFHLHCVWPIPHNPSLQFSLNADGGN